MIVEGLAVAYLALARVALPESAKYTLVIGVSGVISPWKSPVLTGVHGLGDGLTHGGAEPLHHHHHWEKIICCMRADDGIL